MSSVFHHNVGLATNKDNKVVLSMHVAYFHLCFSLNVT